MSQPRILVPVLPNARLRAWPKHEQGGRAEYLPFADAMSRPYATDAHFAAYSVPSVTRRLGVDGLLNEDARAQLEGAVRMVLAVFDVDDTAAHRGEAATADDARLLAVTEGAALLVERRVIVDGHGQRVEATESRYPGDRYALDVRFEVDDGEVARVSA